MEPTPTDSLASAAAALADLPGVAVLLFDRDMRFEAAFGGAIGAHGYVPDRLVGRRAADVLPAPAYERIGPLLVRALTGEQFEEEVQSYDGTGEYVLAFSPVRVGAEIVGGMAVAREVTEQRRAERRFRELAESATDLITISDAADGRILYCSPSFAGLGLDQALVVGTHADLHVHPEDVPVITRARDAVIAGGGPETVTVRLRDGAGQWQAVESDLRGVRGFDGAVAEVHSSGRIVTEQLAQRRREAEARETFERAFADAPIGMCLVGLDGRFQRVNRALLDMLGYEERVLLSRTFQDITHEDDLNADLAQVERLVSGDIGGYSMEKRYFTSAGRLIWVLLSVSMIHDEDGAPQVFLSQIVDITERKRTEERLRHLADRDPLTGLLNRRRFAEELDRQVGRAQRYGERAALLAFDLDGFKYVNDTLGHKAGDDLLLHVARTIRDRLRDTDVLARLGGDEFAALLPNVGLADATRIGQEVCERVASSPLHIEGEAVQLTLSAGVTVLDEHRTDEADAMIAADVALYEAKDQGRGRAVAYEDAGVQGRRLTRGLTWSRRIRRALASDGFTLHAQPIVDLTTGETAMHELLLRLPESDGSLVGPADFLHTAERFGLIRHIDRWVIGAATRLAAAHPGRVLSVNLSGRSVSDPGLGAWVEEAIRDARCDAAQLVFEVTETEAIAAMEPARDLARRLRRLGCRFALDDFGSGFASFYHLKTLPLDLLKIDGEFVRELERDAADQLVVEAVQRVASGMGKELVGEHVEDAATAARLAGLGVRYGQGYHFGRPAPAADVLSGLD